MDINHRKRFDAVVCLDLTAIYISASLR
jgi:hypothetical protein